jgi:hypothetical protein
MPARSPFAPFLLTFALVLAGCPSAVDDDDAADDDDSAQEELPELEVLELDVTETVLLADQVTEPVPYRFLETQADQFDRSDCGDIGVVYFEGEGTWAMDVMLVERGADPDLVGSAPNTMMPAYLHYDDACAPHVVAYDSDGYTHWVREGAFWTEHSIDLSQFVGGFWHLGSTWGEDGRLHLFTTVYNDDFTAFQGVFHATFEQGAWSTELLEPIEADDDEWRAGLDLLVVADGTIHVLYSRNRHLAYARTDGAGWLRETIREREVFDHEPAWGGSLALDAAGVPHVVATEADRRTTGSLIEVRLIWHTRAGGTWSGQTVLAESDGYAGGDGTNYTGLQPFLVFDAAGVAHIVFTDLASWHDDLNQNDTIRGHLRYLQWDGEGWKVASLVPQPDQLTSPELLHELLLPQLRLDGSTLQIFAMERVTDGPTVTYDPDPLSSHRLLLFEADLP